MIPLWFKIFYTAYAIVLVPSYLVEYDLLQFLWFSNIAFLLTCVALWRESSLLVSMMAIAVAIPELIWNIGFFGRLLFGIEPVPITAYMFSPDISLHVRLLSLYHVPLPFLLIWLVYKLGYDKRALLIQTLLGWGVIAASFVLTDPPRNVNWAHGYLDIGFIQVAPIGWLLFLFAGFPLLIYWPTHSILNRCFGNRQTPAGTFTTLNNGRTKAPPASRLLPRFPPPRRDGSHPESL